MPRSDRVRESYDLVAAKYAEARDQTSSIPYLEQLSQNLAANSLILDLGCGAGLPVDRWLVDRGHRVIGLDVSGSMLDLARSNVPDATYQLGDIGELKAEQFSVDAVVSFFALIHVDRIHHRRVIETIRTYLGLSGLLLMTTGRSAWEGKEDFLGAEMTWSHFDRATYRQLIEESGLRSSARTSIGETPSMTRTGIPSFLLELSEQAASPSAQFA